MQAKSQTENDADGEKRVDLQLSTTIGEQVLHTLGKPVGFHRIQVRRLWGDRFRVNVFIGADAASVIIAHSFFLVADEAGKITAVTPKITKRY
ncbi:MAG: hypothetical protein EXS16_05960 [Gemmataceae bacterium]|nr:hypothetical protein [Gemmataceae bacterium]